MSSSRVPLDVCRVLGLGVFCFSLSFLLAESSVQGAAQRFGGAKDGVAHETPMRPPAVAQRAGARIYIDPATGLRGTPPAGAAEDPILKAPVVPRAALRSEHAADGTVRVRLQGNFRSYSVATVSPSGVLTQDCFDDAEAAAAAVRAGSERGLDGQEPVR